MTDLPHDVASRGSSAVATRTSSRAAGSPTTVGVPTPRQDRDGESIDVAGVDEQPTGAGTFARLIGLVIFGLAAIAGAVGPQVEIAPTEGILLGFWSVLYATEAPSVRVAIAAMSLAALLALGVAGGEGRAAGVLPGRGRRHDDPKPPAPKRVNFR